MQPSSNGTEQRNSSNSRSSSSLIAPVVVKIARIIGGTIEIITAIVVAVAGACWILS